MEIEVLKKKIKEAFGTGVDSEYLADLWRKFHELRGYISYDLREAERTIQV